MEVQDSLDYYNKELEYYRKAVARDWFHKEPGDPCWENRDELEKSQFKDDRVRKLDIILFYLLLKSKTEDSQRLDLNNPRWYSQTLSIYKKIFPIEHLPEYLKPMYKQYLNNEKVILPTEVEYLYEQYLEQKKHDDIGDILNP